jgi:hypothetical protein
MKLFSTEQVSPASLRDQSFDSFIGSSGYESRAVYCLKCFDPKTAAEKIAFGFGDRITPQREDNDRTLERSGVDLVAASGDSGDIPGTYLRNVLRKTNDRPIRLLVDYTSMTRRWYASLLLELLSSSRTAPVECFFLYVPAIFNEPNEVAPNAAVGPIPGFCSLDVPDKPTALIIGLGYEKERALGLLEYVDPALCFAFYTDPTFDSRYIEVVRSNNSGLLASLPSERVFAHPLSDLQYTGNLLLSLCCGLQEDYRIILAPLGVKPFSLLCLLIASRFQDIDVWRVTPGTKAPPQDRKAAEHPLVIKASFR